MNDNIEIRRVDAADVRPLRAELLRPGTPPDELVFEGDDDPQALHLGAFANDKMVGIASVVQQPPAVSVGLPDVHPDPDNAQAWRLRTMAVSPDWQGAGVGGLLLKAAIGYVATQEGTVLWCDARTNAVSFYNEHGFVAMGDEYAKPQAGPHFFMQRGMVPGDVAFSGDVDLGGDA